MRPALQLLTLFVLSLEVPPACSHWPHVMLVRPALLHLCAACHPAPAAAPCGTYMCCMRCIPTHLYRAAHAPCMHACMKVGHQLLQPRHLQLVPGPQLPGQRGHDRHVLPHLPRGHVPLHQAVRARTAWRHPCTHPPGRRLFAGQCQAAQTAPAAVSARATRASCHLDCHW